MNWRKLDICNDIVDSLCFRMTSVTDSAFLLSESQCEIFNCIQTIYFIGIVIVQGELVPCPIETSSMLNLRTN